MTNTYSESNAKQLLEILDLLIKTQEFCPQHTQIGRATFYVASSDWAGSLDRRQWFFNFKMDGMEIACHRLTDIDSVIGSIDLTPWLEDMKSQIPVNTELSVEEITVNGKKYRLVPSREE